MKKTKQLRSLFREKLMKPRGLMTAVILLAVSAAIIAGVTLAWYDSFKAIQTENLVLESEGQLVSVDGFTLFTYEDEECGLTEDKAKIKLKSYDSVFGKNSETPMYILVPVRGQAVQEAGHTLHFTFDYGDSLLTVTDENGKTMIAKYFSNVAQLSYVVLSNPSGLISYLDARNQFHSVNASASSPECFASFEVAKDTSGKYVLQPDYSKDPLILSMSNYPTSEVIYVLFELDYNFDLVTGFVNNYANDSAGRLDQNQQLDFEYDMNKITVSAD